MSIIKFWIQIFLIIILFTNSCLALNAEKNYWQQYNQAKTLITNKSYRQALPILNSLLNHQENFIVYILAAKAYEAQLRPEMAFDLYEKAFNLAQFGPTRYKVQSLFGLARTKLALKDAISAREYYKKLLSYNLSNEDKKIVEQSLNFSQPILARQLFKIKAKKAEDLIKKNNVEEASKIINQLLKQNKPNSYILLLAGHIKALENNPEKALVFYNKALKLAQVEKNQTLIKISLFNIARMYLVLKKPDQAEQTYENLSLEKLSKQDFEQLTKLKQQTQFTKQELKLDLIRNILDRGNPHTAFEKLQPLLSSSSFSGYLLAGDILSKRQEPSRALEYYKKSHEIAIENKNETHEVISLFSIARIYNALNKHLKAKEIYTGLLTRNISTDKRKAAIKGISLSNQALQEMALIVKIQSIQKLIDNSQGIKALALIKPLINNNSTATINILAGAGFALTNQHELADKYYNDAIKVAQAENNEALVKIATLGLARAQLNMNKTLLAEKTYLSLLQMNLSSKQKKITLKGLFDTRTSRLSFEVQHQMKNKNMASAYHSILTFAKKFNQTNYILYAANHMLIIGRTSDAIKLYKYAFNMALSDKNIEFKKKALIGLSEAHMSTDNYVRATDTYKKLLTYTLNETQNENAKAGLIKSYAYRGWNYTAFNEIPWSMKFNSPNMVIATLQTTLWIGRGDITQSLYTKYFDILKTIKPGSHLYYDLKNIEWLLCLSTAPYQLNPKAYYFKDSEDFIIHRDAIRFRRYWSQEWQSSASLEYLNYSQFSRKIDGISINLNQIWAPSRFLKIEAGITPTQLSNWNPFLWQFNSIYTPNDLISLNFGIEKEILEGFTAIENKISYENLNAQTVLQPFPYTRLVGSVYQLNMTDQNTRRGFNLNGQVTFVPEYGVYGSYRIRDYSSKFQSPFYFSPEHYRQNLFILGMSQRVIRTWRYFLEGGYGTQTIKPRPEIPEGTGPSWYYRGGVRGPITRCIYFDLEYGKYNQASTFIDSDDYSYRDLRASLTISFD